MDAKSAESKSKKQLGSDTKIVIPDEFTRDCRQIEKYSANFVLIVIQSYYIVSLPENIVLFKVKYM